MIKIAVFLEGHTELIFVREMLLKVFEWSPELTVKCFNLPRNEEFQPTSYDYENDNPIYCFYLYNVGTDARVLSALIDHEKRMWNSDFQRIVGLQDMFSDNYKKVVKNQQIDGAVNQKFIEKHRETITKEAEKPQNIFFFFAIMEIEAWILGVKADFTDIDTRLTAQCIYENLGFNLADIDPETYFFHPATKGVEAIFGLAGQKYDKKQEVVNKLMAGIEQADIANLLASDKCESFKGFYKSLLIEENIRRAVELILMGASESEAAEQTGLAVSKIQELQHILTPPTP